jgi:hypothetical protein
MSFVAPNIIILEPNFWLVSCFSPLVLTNLSSAPQLHGTTFVFLSMCLWHSFVSRCGSYFQRSCAKHARKTASAPKLPQYALSRAKRGRRSGNIVASPAPSAAPPCISVLCPRGRGPRALWGAGRRLAAAARLEQYGRRGYLEASGRGARIRTMAA